MKKFFVSLAVVCMISLLAVSAFAIGNYPNTNADWGGKAVTEEDGSVTISVDVKKVEAVAAKIVEDYNKAATEAGKNPAPAWKAYNLIHVAIYDAAQKFDENSNMTGDGNPYTVAQAGPSNKGLISAGVVNVKNGTAPEGDTTNAYYTFEKGKKYYAYVCIEGQGPWVWNYQPIVFTYGENGESKPTADFSVIAYAVAAITGCGALVVAKKRG